MIVRIPGLLEPRPLAHIRERLAAVDWEDGRITAGPQAAKVKHNDQLTEDHPVAKELGEVVLMALSRSALFTSAALPLKVFPPMFNRYTGGGHFGAHIDTAVRLSRQPPHRVRTDLSATLFLADPDSYDGGELVIGDSEEIGGVQAIKLAAGDLLLYPATHLHEVRPVTRGARLASFFWVQSMVRDDDNRRLLYDMDRALMTLRELHPEGHPALIRLTGTYHNLLRKWSDL
ncbi:Fe2+-dependent dioxygenase [Nevskia sp.]|uniref:Fe2+-dependent dioxygenase n=1 Tax=Nevskia sp. TaxID=1929292 RepID=UPI0025F8B763|nr:Fe2+-dependent dioxygenase [Nevskia sp.]